MDRDEQRPEPSTDLLGDQAGASYVEYIVLTTTVAVSGASALAVIGVPLLNLYYYVNLMILLPIP